MQVMHVTRKQHSARQPREAAEACGDVTRHATWLSANLMSQPTTPPDRAVLPACLLLCILQPTANVLTS